MKSNGDFTARERKIREAMFAVFDERPWELTWDAKNSEIERWKFIDAVTDKLRGPSEKKR